MSENVLTLPIGNGLTMRLEDHPTHAAASLYRGRYPKAARVAFFMASRDEISRIRLDKCGADGTDSLWFPGSNIELTATAAKRIATWLSARGIGQAAAPAPQSGATDALDALSLNTDTPAPAAPGGLA